MSSIMSQDEPAQGNSMDCTSNEDILRVRSPVSAEIEFGRGVNSLKIKGDEERKKRQRESSKRYRENIKIKNESMKKATEQFENALPTIQQQVNDLKEEIRTVRQQMANMEKRMSQMSVSSSLSNGIASVESPCSNFGGSRSQSPQTNVSQNNHSGSLSDSPLMTNLPNQGSPLGPILGATPQLPGQPMGAMVDQSIFNPTPFGTKTSPLFTGNTASSANFPFINTVQTQQPMLLNQMFPSSAQLHPGPFNSIMPLGYGGISLPRPQNNGGVEINNAGNYNYNQGLGAFASALNNISNGTVASSTSTSTASGIPGLGINLQAPSFDSHDFLPGKNFSNQEKDIFMVSYDKIKNIEKQLNTNHTGSSNSFLFFFILALPLFMFPFFAAGQASTGNGAIRAASAIPALSQHDIRIINNVASQKIAHIMDTITNSGVEDLSSSDSENEFVFGNSKQFVSQLSDTKNDISSNIKFNKSMGVKVNSLQEYDSLMARRNSLEKANAMSARSLSSLNVASGQRNHDGFVDKYALATNVVSTAANSAYEQNFMPYIQYITETFFQMALARGIKDPSNSLKDNFFRNLVNDLYDVMIDVTKKFCDSLLEACYNYEYSPANITQITNTTNDA